VTLTFTCEYVPRKRQNKRGSFQNVTLYERYKWADYRKKYIGVYKVTRACPLKAKNQAYKFLAEKL
jgi:hypothetical protein